MTDATVLAHHNQPSFQVNPFVHWLDCPCLTDAHYEALVQTFPTLNLFAPDAASRDNAVLRIDSSRVLSEEAFSRPWKRFVEDHTSQAFWGQLVRRFGAEIRRYHPAIEDVVGRSLDEWKAVRRGAGEVGDVTLECQLVVNTPVMTQASAVKAPHVDHVTKLWTGLLYLRDPADDSSGGDLQLYGSPRPVHFDAHQASRRDVVVASQVSYRPNSFVGFVNGPQAVHSVSPRAPTPHVRRYVDFVAEIDRPVFRLPQMNPARRLFFRFFQREQSR